MKTSYVVVFIIFSALSLSSAFAQWSTDPLVNTRVTASGANEPFPGSPGNPSSVSDGMGGVIITYGNFTKEELYAQRIDASGNLMWGSNGITLSHNSRGNISFIISDGTGGAFVTYAVIDTSYDKLGQLYLANDCYAQRLDQSGNERWKTGGVPIATGNGGQSPLDMISDGADGVFIAITDTDGMHIQRVSPTGVTLWQKKNGIFIDSLSGGGACKIVSDGSNGVIICYLELDSNALTVPDYGIYAQRISSTGSKLWPKRIDVCTARRPRYEPVIISDGTNGAIIAWTDQRIYGNTDIFAQRIDSSGKPLWATNGTSICGAANEQIHPVITSDGIGGTFIAWEDRRTGGSLNIYAQHVDKSGASLWTPNGAEIFKTPNFLAYNSLMSISMISDGSGGVIMAWADQRNDGPNFRETNYDIFAQRVNADSTVQWKPNGVAVSTASGNQVNPIVVSSGGGNIIVTWDDARNTPIHNVFAQRINSTGVLGGSSIAIPVPTFPPNGTLLTDTTVTLRWGKIGGAIAYQLQCGTDPTFNTQLLVDLSNLTDTIHLITGLQRSSTYYWRVRAIGQIAHHKDNQIQSTPGDWSSVNNFKTPGAANSVSENRINASAIDLYPNPASTNLSISYTLPLRSQVSIEIFNALGEKIMTLPDETEDQGMHNRQVDVRSLNSGSYEVRFITSGMQSVKKFTIVR